jgi:hypothetical protein
LVAGPSVPISLCRLKNKQAGEAAETAGLTGKVAMKNGFNYYGLFQLDTAEKTWLLGTERGPQG